MLTTLVLAAATTEAAPISRNSNLLIFNTEILMFRKFIVLLFLPLSVLLMFYSCDNEEDTDTTAPVITLNGDAVDTVYIGNVYNDPGATANDETDGDLTSSVITTSTVDVNAKGSYSITYSVADLAGNTSTETRIVRVVNSAWYLEGGYSVMDIITGTNAGTRNYNVSVSSSSTENNKIFIKNFGEYGSLVSAEAMVADSVLTISSQQLLLNGDTSIVTGNGSIQNYLITGITYNAVYNSGGTDNGNAVYTKL